MIPHPSDTCIFLCLSYKHMVVSWFLLSPCNVPDMVVKKLAWHRMGLCPLLLKDGK